MSLELPSMAMTTRRQVARRHLIVREISTQEAADFIGCHLSHLSNVLNGRSRPNDLVRERLPKLIGLPIEALLDADLLTGEYSGPHGRRRAAE